MKYPLSLTFKILALAPQVYVRDADGNLRMYVRQKAFKLKEAVSVFSDEQQTSLLYRIEADRVFDFRAHYRFTDAGSGAEIGGVKRQGMRSIWRARFDIMQGDQVIATIQEENPWVKVIDGLLGEVPILGMLTGYFANPAYSVTAPDGSVLMRLIKEPAFLEGKYRIEKVAEMPESDEPRLVLALFMMLLLERTRG